MNPTVLSKIAYEKYSTVITTPGWEQVAKDVLAGKYNKATDSSVHALMIGLKHQQTPNGIKAIEVLCKTFKKKNPNEKIHTNLR